MNNPAAPKVAVLVLGYNDEHNLVEALSSALDQTYQNFELIYIDNASRDGSLALVRKNYPALRTIAYEKNLGYAGAYAKVLEQIFQEDFTSAVLLNSDVVVDKAWLEELVVSAYADEKIALAQPKIFLHGKDKDLANTFGNHINYLGFGFCGHYKQPDNDDFQEDQQIVSASGASLLVKKEAYIALGGMDANFFAYLEDQDLSWRALMQGYQIVLSAKSKMWHKYVFQKNSRNSWKFFTLERNRLFFLFKNYSAKTLILLSPMFLVMEMGILADSLTMGYFKDKIRSYKAFFTDFGKIYRLRQKAQEGRQLPDSELFARLSPTVYFEEIDSFGLRIANGLLKTYYKVVKPFI